MKGKCWKKIRWGWRECRIKERVWGGVEKKLDGIEENME